MLGDQEIDVTQDKYSFIPAQPIWDEICRAIENPEIDGFAFYTTPAWLNSEACAEELNLAFSNCMTARGRDFPLIAIVPKDLDTNSLPLILRSRLFVKTIDPNWFGVVRHALDGTPPDRPKVRLEDFDHKWHAVSNGKAFLEVWPRIGEWSHLCVLEPVSEIDDDGSSGFSIYPGPPGGFIPGGRCSIISYDYWNIEGERWRQSIYSGPYNASTRAYVHFPVRWGRKFWGPISNSGIRPINIFPRS